MRKALVATWLALCSSAPLVAEASPMEDTALSGAVFSGPTHPHGSSIFVNPAALGLTGKNWSLNVGGSGRLNSLWVDRDLINAAGQQTAGPSTSEHTLTPGGYFSVYGSPLENTHFGLGFFVPTLEFFPEGNDNIAYHSEGGSLTQGMATLAGSYSVGDRLHLGLAISIGYVSFDYRFARDTAPDRGSAGVEADCGGSPCGYEHPDNREHYSVRAGSEQPLEGILALKNISASIGVAYRLRRDIWLALSYVALPGAFGDLSLSGEVQVERSANDGGALEEGTAEVLFSMPQMLNLGLRMPAFEGYEFVSDLRWSDYSRHDQFDIRTFGGTLGAEVPEWLPRYRGMNDTIRVSAGLEGTADSNLRVGGRLRFESAALQGNEATPLDASGASITAALGSQLRLTESIILQLGYELSWFPTMDASNSVFDPREQVACVDSQFDFDQCAAARDGRGFATAAGSYQRLQHGFLLSLRYDQL